MIKVDVEDTLGVYPRLVKCFMTGDIFIATSVGTFSDSVECVRIASPVDGNLLGERIPALKNSKNFCGIITLSGG